MRNGKRGGGGILRSGQGSVRNGKWGGGGYCEAGSEV